MPPSKAEPTPAERVRAYQSLLGELCSEVQVDAVDNLIPRVQQLCEAVLTLPPLDAFASEVCDLLGRLMMGDDEANPLCLSLEQAVVVLNAVIQELKQLRFSRAAAALNQP